MERSEFDIIISEVVRDCCPNLRLGCLLAEVKVEESSPALWEALSEAMDRIQVRLTVEEISSLSTISATRKGYKALGKDPARYRPSAEALLRRITTGKGLYRVNNVVDIINAVSAETGFSIGGYNLDSIQGSIRLDKGPEGVPYEAIGRGDLNIANLPVFFDQIGPFGSPTSDSVRTSIGLEATTIAWMIFDFSGNGPLDNALALGTDYLTRFANAREVSMSIFAI